MLKAIDFVCIVLILNFYFAIVVSSGRSSPRNYRSHVMPFSNKPLILTKYIKNNWIDMGRNFARVKLKDSGNIKSYSGYLTVDEVLQTNLFFWFFPSKSNYTNDPIILWLQGGARTSFMLGLFAEHGPFLVTQENKLRLRDISWVNRHSVLYIDSPHAGFSFSKPIGGMKQYNIVINLYSAVRQFFKLFPKFRKNEFYITGQSYAGRFVTSLGYLIMTRNRDSAVKINLKGMAIGNAVIDPVRQYKYGKYLYQLGLITDTRLEDFLNIEESIKICMGNKDYKAFDQKIIELQRMFLDSTKHINPINYIEDEGTVPALERSYLSYINQDDTRKAIHVGDKTYNSYSHVFDDIGQQPVDKEDLKITELLENYRILFYTGQLDTVVNPARISEFLQSMNILKPVRYFKLFRGLWIVDENLAGYTKIVGNLTELTVRVAGQMVPLDAPEWALDMITRFTRGEKLMW